MSSPNYRFPHFSIWNTSPPPCNYASLGLHEEIENLYKKIHGNGQELAKRRAAFQRVSTVIAWLNPGVLVDCFGSTATGLFLPESDIDIVVFLPENPQLLVNGYQVDRVQWLEILQNQLILNITPGLRLGRMDLFKYPLMPVLKVTDVETGLKLDISCAGWTSGQPHFGMHNSNWIRSAVVQHPELPKLVTVLKKLLQHRSLLGVASGGISSYALTLMAVSCFQRLVTANDNLGDALLKFLRFFGKDFSYKRSAITVVEPGGFVSKVEMQKKLLEKPGLLCIQDPVNPAKDAARPSRRGVEAVRKMFVETQEQLEERVMQAVVFGKPESFFRGILF